MKIIDLSIALSNNTPVYPGDPKIDFQQIFFLKQDGWNMTRFAMNTHDGTHVNVPLHAKENGKTLDSYILEDFIGEVILFETVDDIIPDVGVIFSNENISIHTAKIIVEKRPKFVGLSSTFEFDLEVEKYLLENDIISFERLENTSLLPKKCIFYGIPLKIQDGDGSPVRAFAMV